MQVYLYLLLILSIIFSTLAIFSNKVFKNIVSFLLLIISVCAIGISNNNALLSLIIFLCYSTINYVLILINYYNNKSLDE